MNEDDTFQRLKKVTFEEIMEIVSRFGKEQYYNGFSYLNASEEELDMILNPILKPFGWTRKELVEKNNPIPPTLQERLEKYKNERR